MKVKDECFERKMEKERRWGMDNDAKRIEINKGK